MVLLETVASTSNLEVLAGKLIEQGAQLGMAIVKAALIFVIGRFVINMLNKLVAKLLVKRSIELSVRTFISSLVNITLTILLLIAVIGALGIQTSSFAALLASFGVAIGMALSGNLSNFAGGLIILLFKPYRVGDYIEAQGIGGTVKEIQIFHTLVTTPDGKEVFVPNGSMSSGVVTNYNVPTRRVEWIVGVEYGTDINKLKELIDQIIKKDNRVLPNPAPFFRVHAMADSSINVIVRVWVKSSDYWDVYFETNKAIYEDITASNIEFAYPQITVHQAKN